MDTRGVSQLDFRLVVQSAKDKVFPCVVFIKVLQESNESGKKITQELAGSGVIISEKGEVLTNWHVVDKAVDIRCLLYDGRPMDAKVVGTDKDTDLALLQLAVPAGGKVPSAEIGDSTVLKEGDFVMAMGAPWGLSRSVSMGIISCTQRFLANHSEYSLWLQTDASISPGNSGGPLVNTCGQVIGINALGYSSGGDLGFAIPSQTFQYVVEQLRRNGRMDWSYTGLQLQPIRDFNKNMYFEGAEGVIVAETFPDSPARRAGIGPKDRILKVGGKPVTALTEDNLPGVRRELGLLAKNQPVTVEILRDGKTLSIQLTPREKGKVEGDELACPRWDLTVKTINEFDNPDLYFHRQQGVFVYGVKHPGNASAASISAQDIILKVEGKEIETLDDIKAVHQATVADVAKKNKIMLTVLRNGLMRQIVLDIQRDYEKE
jgi:serine protease Do